MYELLSDPIRHYIRDKGWESLRSIQDAAIKYILPSTDNIILASRTASGKTEAAFLPILSKVNFRSVGVKVLYISPLIALINDQFVRIEELCLYLDVPVTKWHGEAKRSLKEKLIREPEGVLLITPESLEAMFVNNPQYIKRLFNHLEYVVIDEIHSFLGTNRGVQLQSLLSRLKRDSGSPFSLVGLSATIGDYEAVKDMTGDPANTKVLRDTKTKSFASEFKYFPNTGAELPLDLLKDLYRNTADNKVLIFPNARGLAEEVAVKLKKISEKVGGHPYYYSHHSSVDREVREYVEQFAKGNQRYPFAIACTSTLELGIDIGSVDKVVQIDAASSIASLIQRVGRSGRKDGMESALIFYATNPWSLVQSLACYLLYKEGFVEPARNNPLAYDILLQQILSVVRQTGGCRIVDLKWRMQANHAFSEIDEAAIDQIVRHLIEIDFLELIGGELIIGVEGERVVNTKDFYSVFRTDPVYKVVYAGRPVGEIPLSSIIVVDENIFLAARIWKVKDIDQQAKKIAVIPANDGKKPKFSGDGMDVHGKVREKMLELLMSSEVYPELNDAAANTLQELRASFNHYTIEDLAFDRPMIEKEAECILFTFQSSKANRALQFLLGKLDRPLDIKYVESNSSFDITGDLRLLKTSLNKVIRLLPEVDNLLDAAIAANPYVMVSAKWGVYLPARFQRELIKQTAYDFEGLKNFLQNVRLVRHEDLSTRTN